MKTIRKPDPKDAATRRVMGRALRTTYALDMPLPESLAGLMQQVAQHLDAPGGVIPIQTGRTRRAEHAVVVRFDRGVHR